MPHYDAIVIGAGQAGNPLSQKLADHGWAVALVEKDHLGLLRWACQNGYPYGPTMQKENTWTCAQAARKGDLENLQWLCEKGFTMDAYTCSQAAAGGHLEVLQWARQNGCPG